MAGHLTTHVLDTANGGPAAGMRLALYRVDREDGPELLTEAVTNADGRTDSPLRSKNEMEVGLYVIEFEAGEYFEKKDGESPFLGTVPVMFKISDPGAGYHVPLLCSPWSYSTYRGS